MVVLSTKMPTFIYFVGSVVLLVIFNLCETLSYTPLGSRNQNTRLDYSSPFDDEGSVQIKVSGQHYVMREDKIFVEKSYGDSDTQLTNLIPVDVHPDNFLEHFAGHTTSPVYEVANVTWDSDNPPDFLTELPVLSLETLLLRNLSYEMFEWLTNMNLRCLNLRHTSIEIVAEDALKPVQNTLQVLDLSYAIISGSDLQALMHGLHNNRTQDHSSNLVVLSLANLDLRRIPYQTLSFVKHSLQALSLSGNYFQILGEEIDMLEEGENDTVQTSAGNYFSNILERSNPRMGRISATFPQMPYLLELNLCHCGINSVEPGAFRNLGSLRSLRISGNNIVFLQDFVFEGLTNLATLDITSNRLKTAGTRERGLRLTSNSFEGLHYLQTMNFSYTLIHPSSVQFLSRLPPSLTTLELRACNLSKLSDRIFVELSNLQVLNLSNNFGITQDLTATSFEGLDMLQELYMSSTSLQDLGILKELSSLRLLDVRHNRLATFEGILEVCPLLETLDVSSNFINSWREARAFAGNTKLQTVHLHSNVISLMTKQMMDDFMSLSYLTLANNSFVCNCHLKFFMETLIDMNNNTIEDLPILKDYQSNGMAHLCTDATLSNTMDFADTDAYCTDVTGDYWLSALQHGIYISMLSLVCSLSLGGLIYWKWYESLVGKRRVQLRNATILSMINVENSEDRIYTYDVFVSYSDANRKWVIDELIPNIEGSEARLSICLHERDFQVGVSILENIVMAIDQSRTILLIISGCFIKSQWCQFEMHLAQHRLLETCREQLVLVLLEEIPRKKRPKTLHYLMMVKTYIVWPKNSNNEVEKKLFWKRLRRAINANKLKHSSVV